MARFSEVAVVACAQTELRLAWSGAQHVDLISSTVSQLLKGSGVGLPDVDFVIDSGSDVLDGRSISNCGFLGAMGAHHKEESRVEEDGLWAVMYGATKIAAGAAEIGLIIAYSKPSESDVSLFYASQVEPFYQRPVGFDHLAASGIQAQQYILKSGGREADSPRLRPAPGRRRRGTVTSRLPPSRPREEGDHGRGRDEVAPARLADQAPRRAADLRRRGRDRAVV